MKTRSGHLILDKSHEYKDLLPVFEEIFMTFLERSDLLPEEPAYTQMLLQENLDLLEKNKKPYGFNRQGKIRLVFPIKEKGDPIEFYVYGRSQTARSSNISQITHDLSTLLQKNGIKHDLDWDKMLAHTIPRRR